MKLVRLVKGPLGVPDKLGETLPIESLNGFIFEIVKVARLPAPETLVATCRFQDVHSIHVRGVVMMRLRTDRTELNPEMCIIFLVIDFMCLQEILDLNGPHLVELRHLDIMSILVIIRFVKSDFFLGILPFAAAGRPVVRIDLSKILSHTLIYSLSPIRREPSRIVIIPVIIIVVIYVAPSAASMYFTIYICPLK